MATIRAKLVSSGLPFNYKELTGATIIPVPGDLQALSGAEAIADDTSQAYFLQNVLPIQRGYSSVHFTKAVGIHTYPVYMDDLFQLRDDLGNVALFSPTKGKCLVYSKDTGEWVAYPIPAYPTTAQVTTAYLRGVTYICFAGIGLYKYDFDTQQIVTLTTAGLLTSAVQGILASSGYLIAYTTQEVAYSNPLNPLDFVPVLGGAGSSGILANRGDIVVALTLSDGFIVYTTHNAVAARYTNNPNVPFAYNEIPNSAGVSSPRHVAYQGTAAQQLAWTSAGFMLVSFKQAQFVWPELSDSVAAGIYTTLGYNESPMLVHATELEVRIAAVGGRYYTVSLRNANTDPNEYKFAYVYDLALDRWGRIDIAHVAFFEYSKPEFVADLTYAQLGDQTYEQLGDLTYAQLVSQIVDKTAHFGTTLGCVNALGAVHIALSPQVANLDNLESDTSGAATPKIVLGRYRMIRPDAVMLTKVVTNSLAADFAPTVTAIGHAQDGESIKKVPLSKLANYSAAYVGRVNGAFVSVSVEGRFQLSLLELELTGNGTYMPPRQATGVQIPANVVTVEGIPVTVGGEYVTT